jgi:hypothetical protein
MFRIFDYELWRCKFQDVVDQLRPSPEEKIPEITLSTIPISERLANAGWMYLFFLVGNTSRGNLVNAWQAKSLPSFTYAQCRIKTSPYMSIRTNLIHYETCEAWHPHHIFS